MNNLKQCSVNCPDTESSETIDLQNLGCLPCPYEIKQMLKEGKVWMCHQNFDRPCVATGLSAVSEGYVPVTQRDFQY